MYMVAGGLELVSDFLPRVYKYFIVVDFVTQKRCGKIVTTIISKYWREG